MHCTGLRRAHSIRIIWIYPAIAARGILRIEVAWKRPTRPGRAVVEVKHLLVKLMGCRPRTEDGIDICYGGGFKLRAGQNGLRTVRKQYTHALGVEEEE